MAQPVAPKRVVATQSAYGEQKSVDYSPVGAVERGAGAGTARTTRYEPVAGNGSPLETLTGRWKGGADGVAHKTPYNFEMADRIACSCVTCPKCGTWVVVRQQTEGGENKEKFRASCPVPECGKEFEFEMGETRFFDLPLPLFERRHFYRSEIS